MQQRLLKSTDFTNRPTYQCLCKNNIIMLPFFWSHFYTPVIWLWISGENCHFDPLQNRLLSKCSSMTFHILAFITIHVSLFSEKNSAKSKIWVRDLWLSWDRMTLVFFLFWTLSRDEDHFFVFNTNIGVLSIYQCFWCCWHMFTVVMYSYSLRNVEYTHIYIYFFYFRFIA